MPQTTAPDPNLRTLDPQSPVSANGTGCDLRGIGRDAHTYIHTYLCTYLLTYVLTYFLMYVLTYLCTYLLTYLLTYLCTYITYLLTYVLTYLLMYLLTYLLIYLLTYLRNIYYIHTPQTLFLVIMARILPLMNHWAPKASVLQLPPVSDRIGARPSHVLGFRGLGCR